MNMLARKYFMCGLAIAGLREARKLSVDKDVDLELRAREEELEGLAVDGLSFEALQREFFLPHLVELPIQSVERGSLIDTSQAVRCLDPVKGV